MWPWLKSNTEEVQVVSCFPLPSRLDGTAFVGRIARATRTTQPTGVRRRTFKDTRFQSAQRDAKNNKRKKERTKADEGLQVQRKTDKLMKEEQEGFERRYGEKSGEKVLGTKIQ